MRTPTSPPEQNPQGYPPPPLAAQDDEGNVVERQEVVEDTAQRRSNLRSALTTILSLLFGALEVILLLRLVFRLLGAHTQSDFISWLYSVSHPFVAPFNGIFNDQTLGRHGVFEVSTLIAVIIYGLLAWGVVRLADAALRAGPAGRERRVSSFRRQL